MTDDLDARLRDAETAISVHEAVCAERYRAINFKLNVLLGALGLFLTALMGGNPVAAAISKMFGAH